MPPSKHALLSASSSHRWIECPPSARLCERVKEASTSFAREGSEAHELCEYKLRTAVLGEKANDPTSSLEFYNDEMERCSNDYAIYISEIISGEKAEGNIPIILIEQQLDFSKYVPDGFGTGDCVIVSGSTLYVIDYKHGLGVLVSAEKNSQMLCYALGAYEALKDIYEIKNIVMTIFQPRRENLSTYELSIAELLDWGKNTLAPAAKLAYNGEGEFHPGSHCQFCKVKFTCRARAEHHTKLLSMDFREPELLSNDEIAEVLDKAETLSAWVNDIKEYALMQAVNGKQWNDWKVVEGRSNRKYTDEVLVADTVKNAGFDPYEHKILGITAMTKLLGKNKFEDLLGGFIEKPKGKPTLVPMSDKRPALSKAADAADDFKEEI